MISARGTEGDESAGTVFSAIAAKQNDSVTIEVQVGEVRPILLVDGVEIELEDDLVISYDSVNVRVRNGAYAVTFSSGAYVEVNQSNGFLSSLVISLPRSFYEQTRGLLGVYNGDPSDDLLPFNGVNPLPLNSTMEAIHSGFGITCESIESCNILATDYDNLLTLFKL